MVKRSIAEKGNGNGSRDGSDREAALERALGDIVKQYGDGGGGHPAGSGERDLRSGVVGEDDAVPAHRGRSAEAGRGVRLHRHGACAGPGLCGQVRGGRGEPVHLAAGHGGAGAGDRRDAGEERGGGRGGGGQRGGAGAAGGDRGGHGGRHDGDASAADEPGAAETVGGDQADEYGDGVHQPAAAEDRGDVRESGDDDGGHGAEVLCLGAAGGTGGGGDEGG